MKTKDSNIVYSDTRKVKCSGTEDGLGHPLVYLTIKSDEIICPYCSTKFVFKSLECENNSKAK